jgi:hypothetical protein
MLCNSILIYLIFSRTRNDVFFQCLGTVCVESSAEIIVACCEAQAGATCVVRPALGQSHLHLHNLFCAYPPQFQMFLHPSCLGPLYPACRDLIRKRAASLYHLEDNVDAADTRAGGSNRCTGRPVQPGA